MSEPDVRIDPRAFGRVGVLLGGRSSEREVSLLSGAAVLEALRGAGVDAHPFDPALRSLAELEAERFARAFLILHGRFGEDGAMQGVLEVLGIPYTGSGVRASAVAMDKLVTKRIWAAEGIATPAWASPRPGEDALAAVRHLGDRLVVKPALEGSTFGLTKLGPARGEALRGPLEEALALARGFGGPVVVEECITGRELTVAILGEGEGARALPIVEIQAPGANYDYHNKYFSDETRYLCPAPLDPALAAGVQALCLRAYRALGARGWGRIDVLLREDGTGGPPAPCLLELNTAPGMTGHSLVPMAARAAGIGFPELVLGLLADARTEIPR